MSVSNDFPFAASPREELASSSASIDALPLLGTDTQPALVKSARVLDRAIESRYVCRCRDFARLIQRRRSCSGDRAVRALANRLSELRWDPEAAIRQREAA